MRPDETSDGGRWLRRLACFGLLAVLIAAREAAFNRNLVRYGRPMPPIRIRAARDVDDV